MDRNPIKASFLGYNHEKYDHLLPNGSLEAKEKDIMKYIQQKQKLEKQICYSDLSDEGKINYQLVLHDLDISLFDLNELALWRSGAPGIGPIGNIGNAIFPLYTREYASLEDRIKAIISRLNYSPKYLEETKSTWQYPIKLWTEMAIEEGDRLKQFLRLILGTTESQLQTHLHKKLSTSIKNARKAIETYVDWLRHEILPQANHDWIVGPQKFSRLLEVRKLGKTSEEILTLGEKILRETKIKLRKLANEICPGKTIDEVRELIKNKHPSNSEMVKDYLSKLAQGTRDFIKTQNLLDIPRNEELRIVKTPSFLIPIIPFAAYMGPEKFSKNQIGFYFITPVENEVRILKEHSFASCKNTMVHEAYPGHHLQIVTTNTHANLIRSVLIMGPFPDKLFASETVEGWAHYCEELMVEKGYLGNEEIFMQLIDQLWRAVRIIVDIKIHNGLMKLEEAKLFMIREIGMDENAVLSELKRYTATPGYQLSYLFGKILIKDLRKSVKRKLGKYYDDRFFHNTILQNGGMPLHFLEQLFNLRIAKRLKMSSVLHE